MVDPDDGGMEAKGSYGIRRRWSIALALLCMMNSIGRSHATAPAPAATPTDGCCAKCIGKTSSKPYTYDPVVHDQCAAAQGLCCYNCGAQWASNPIVENAQYSGDGILPQVTAGDWIQITWNNVARVTYEYYRVNQAKVTTVRNGSLEARQEDGFFLICARGAGSIVVRGWGADPCLSATPENTIEVLPGEDEGLTTCVRPPPTSEVPSPTPTWPSSPPKVVPTDDVSNPSLQREISECNLQRASIQTSADGTQQCICAAEWSGPPSCSSFPWWKIALTIGGGIAAVLSIIISVRAFLITRKARQEAEDESADPHLLQPVDTMAITHEAGDDQASSSTSYRSLRTTRKECSL